MKFEMNLKTKSAIDRCPRLFPFLVILMTLTGNVLAQEKNTEVIGDDHLIAAAREIMAEARYCALITLDSTGQPSARMMAAFPPEEGMVVWFGTNPKSRKVQEIGVDSRVTLYYADSSRNGYVTITGSAVLVNNPTEKASRWQEGWEAYYPDRDESYILIKVTPKKIEVVSYKHQLTGNKITWEAPFKVFE